MIERRANLLDRYPFNMRSLLRICENNLKNGGCLGRTTMRSRNIVLEHTTLLEQLERGQALLATF